MGGKESSAPRWENRAVQTEWEQRIKDEASMQFYAEIEQELMRALDPNYSPYTD